MTQTQDGSCSIHPLNLDANAIVTVSYLVLFSSFFVSKYLTPSEVKVVAKENSSSAKVDKSRAVEGKEAAALFGSGSASRSAKPRSPSPHGRETKKKS